MSRPSNVNRTKAITFGRPVRTECGPDTSGYRTRLSETRPRPTLPRKRRVRSTTRNRSAHMPRQQHNPPVAERVFMRRDAMTSYPVPRDDDDRAMWCDGRCDVSVGGIIIMLLATRVRSRSGPRRRAHTRAYTFTCYTFTLSSTYRNKYVYVCVGVQGVYITGGSGNFSTGPAALGLNCEQIISSCLFKNFV